MRFCTQCGAQLADDAKFCTVCGASQVPAEPAPQAGPQPFVPPEAPSVSEPDVSAFSAETEASAESVDDFSSAAAPSATEEQSYIPPTPPEQQSYTPPVGDYAQPAQQSYAPPAGNYAQPAQQGYAAQTVYATPPQPPQQKKKGGKTALIVIGAIVAVAIVAVVLILVLGGSKTDKFVGYWECTAVDAGSGKVDNYLGTDVKAVFQMEVKDDGTFAMNGFGEIVSGTWTSDGDEITLTVYGDSITGELDEKELVLDVEGVEVYFAKTEGSLAAAPAQSAAPTDTTEPDTTPAQAGALNSGYIGDDDEYFIEVLGAEEFTDSDGSPAIRIYYNFTQYTEESTSAWSSIDFKAYQNAGDLETTYTIEDVDVYGNDSLNVRPGTTIQCMKEYAYDPAAGNVTIVFSDWYGDGDKTVEASFDPAALPGAPAAFAPAPVANPDGTQGMADNGAIGDYTVAIKDCEFITDEDGDAAVRVYIDFTNNSTEAESFFYATYYYLYQDNIALKTSYLFDSTASDDAIYDDVAPGATATVSVVYKLRSQSPIEFEVWEIWEDQAVGKMFTVS